MYYEKYKKYKYRYLTGGADISSRKLDFVADVLNYLTKRHKNGIIYSTYKWEWEKHDSTDSTVRIRFNTSGVRFGKVSGKSVQKDQDEIGDKLYINEENMTNYLEKYNIDIELGHFIIKKIENGQVQSVTFTADCVKAFINRYEDFFGTSPRDFVNGLKKENMSKNIQVFFYKLGSFPQYDKMKFKPQYYITINGKQYVNFVILQRFNDHLVKQMMTVDTALTPSSPEPSELAQELSAPAQELSAPEPSAPEPSAPEPSAPEPSALELIDKEKKILHLLFSNILDIDKIMRQLNETRDLFLKIFGELDSMKCDELRRIMYIKS